MRFGAYWVCLVAGFRDGLFGSWASLVPGFSGGWVLFQVVVVVPLGFVWVFGDFLFGCLVS